MNTLQAPGGASGGGAASVESSIFATATTDTTMIKIPRPKFTINRTNGNHKGDLASGEASKGAMSSSFFQQPASASTSTSNPGASSSSYHPYQEPPVDYWSANNSNSSSNTDLRSITKQLDKDCKI